ncbi:MAG TPA: hypothetical protein VHH36_09515 [Candidatus Thermoplasmatota archaeon]|nr:hypothetical protein [Candidatus Thermoplasmatota archaeon]
MKIVPLVLVALALVALPAAPGVGAASVPLPEKSTCVPTGCAYNPTMTIGAPTCGDDGTGYACAIVLSTRHDAAGYLCATLGYDIDAPHAGQAPGKWCATGVWFRSGSMRVVFRDIPAEGLDVEVRAVLSVTGLGLGESPPPANALTWSAGTVHLPGP